MLDDRRDGSKPMNSAQIAVNEIDEQVETARSHLADLKKVALDRENEQVTESLGVLAVCLDSLESAIKEDRLNGAPRSEEHTSELQSH